MAWRRRGYPVAGKQRERDLELTCYGAAGEVTGSCHHLRVGSRQLLLDCGLFQGTREEEARNARPLPFDPAAIDAVVLSHAHLDHCGRLPLLVRGGFRGPIHTHPVSIDLVRILLRDAAWLEAADVERENRRRAQRGKPPLQPLFEQADVDAVMRQMRPLPFGGRDEILPGITVSLSQAGHILGAASVLLDLQEGGVRRRLLYSGDIGPDGTALIPDPDPPAAADLVLMESTYGDRNHRSFEATLDELQAIFRAAADSGGNILIPAFAVGRTQDLLYLMAEHYADWRLDQWQVFLDSPMAIEATGIYSQHRHLYRAELFREGQHWPVLPNFAATASSEESMSLNRIESGAVIIAGSGMCTGGRIRHHLKHNVWRPQCHVIMIGYQAHGTLGRRLVDKAPRIRLWGETIQVNATVHTVGGLSAHADQDGLLDWYGNFAARPPVYLVHGEEKARLALSDELQKRYGIEAHRPKLEEVVELG